MRSMREKREHLVHPGSSKREILIWDVPRKTYVYLLYRWILEHLRLSRPYENICSLMQSEPMRYRWRVWTQRQNFRTAGSIVKAKYSAYYSEKSCSWTEFNTSPQTRGFQQKNINAILVLVLVPVLARSGECQKIRILLNTVLLVLYITSFFGESADGGQGKADGRTIGIAVETAKSWWWQCRDARTRWMKEDAYFQAPSSQNKICVAHELQTIPQVTKMWDRSRSRKLVDSILTFGFGELSELGRVW